MTIGEWGICQECQDIVARHTLQLTSIQYDLVIVGSSPFPGEFQIHFLTSQVGSMNGESLT